MNKEAQGYREFLKMSERLSPKTAENTSFPVTDFGKTLLDELRLFRSKKIFTKLDEYKSILFVSNHGEERPSAIYARMRALDIRFDYIQRVLPLDIITSFDAAQIREYVLEKNVSGSFKILYEGRLCDGGARERVFQAVLPLMTGRVALDNPEHVVVVQAFKSYVGLSIVGNDAKNFNFSINQ